MVFWHANTHMGEPWFILNYSLTQRSFAQSAWNLTLKKSQRRRITLHVIVTRPCGDHAWSCLTWLSVRPSLLAPCNMFLLLSMKKKQVLETVQFMWNLSSPCLFSGVYCRLLYLGMSNLWSQPSLEHVHYKYTNYTNCPPLSVNTDATPVVLFLLLLSLLFYN